MRKPEIKWAFLAFFIFLFLTSDSFSFIRDDKSSLYEVKLEREPLALTTGGQANLSNSPRWKDFIAKNGWWDVEWNELKETPYSAYGKGIQLPGYAFINESNAEAAAKVFLQENFNLFKIEVDNLELIKKKLVVGKWYVSFRQNVNHIPVYGSEVELRITQTGRVFLFRSNFHPQIEISLTPSISQSQAVELAKSGLVFDSKTDQVLENQLIILPIEKGDKIDYRLTYRVRVKTEDPTGDWICWVDASSGELLWRYNDIKFYHVFGNVTGDMYPMYMTDPKVEKPFIYEQVNVTGVGSDITDTSGSYDLTVWSSGSYNVTSELKGPYVNVNYEDGPDAFYSGTATADSTHDWKWDSTMGLMDELNVYYHVQVIHSYVKKLDPVFTGLDYQMPANVRVGTNYDNAFWDGYSINFGEGSGQPGGFYNFALFCDVIYHEYTHGITMFIVDWPYYGETGAMHEGFSDYFACTLTDEPLIGEVLTVSSPYLRTMDNDLKMPDDWVGEVHADGMIIGGALWDLREALGASLADSLIHFSRYGNPRSFDECYEEVLVVDDDDGDLSNGTPHITEITLAFWKHGIGWGPFVLIAHTPLNDTSDTTNSYRVEANTFSINPLDPDSIFVYYSTGADFSSILMQPTGNPGEYAADIPPQTLLTRIDYYIFAQDTSGVIGTSPEGTPEHFHSFFVQLPPQISVTADSLSTTLYAGDSTQKEFFIKNEGQGYLNFQISHFSGGSLGQSIMHSSSPQIPGMEPPKLEQTLDNTNTFETSEQNLVTPHTYRAENSPVLVALFKDYDPWNNPANEYILQAQGISYNVYTSSSMGIIDLSPYDKVITASVQGDNFWSNLSNHRSWFEDYVRGGGTLEMHLASYSISSLPGMMLPGNLVVSSVVGYDDVTIKDTDHPIVTTPHVITDAELDGWNASAHGHFATMPWEANVIIEDTYNHNPLCIDFQLGAGGIIATIQTVEWIYASPPYLTNMILYTMGSPWLSFFPDSGLIAPGDSIEITVDLNASSLRCDTTISDTLIIISNDPDPSRDTLFIPLTLTVIGVPDIAVSDSIILFDEISIDPFCQPEADTAELWIYNEGCDSVLTVKMILSDTTNFFTFSPDSFDVLPGGSYPLLIYFKPETGGSITGTVTLLSNDPDEGTVEVTLNGIGLWQTKFALSDSLLDLSLYPGQDTTIELLIYNIDRGLLEFKVTRAKQKVDSVGVIGNYVSDLIYRLNNDDYLTHFYHFTNLGYNWSYQDIEPYNLILVDEYYGSFDCSEAEALRDFYYSGKSVIFGMYGLHYENSCEKESVYTVFGVKDAIESEFYSGYLNPLHPISENVILNPWSYWITSFAEDGASWVVAGSDDNYYVLAKDDISRTVIFGYMIYYWWDYSSQLIRNAIDWTNPQWLTVHPFYLDSIPPYESSIIEVDINTSELELDSSYYDTLIIETNNCETPIFTVPLNLEMVCPWICSIPESVVVSAEVGEVDTTRIQVSNCGGGTLIFGVDEDLDWIEVYLEEDSVSSGDTVSVDVVADFSDILPGDYYVGLGILSYTCSGDSFVVLHYNVGPCPDIWVSPESLKIDSLYPGRYKDTTISLGNQGLGSLWYQLSNRVNGNSSVYGLGGEPAHREYEQSYYGQDLGKGEEDYRVGGEVVYDYGGPDDFGYHWIDSDDLGGPEFEWVEISRIGKRVEGLGLDDNVGPFYLGFSFPFYGEDYDSVRICSNGWLSFSSTQTSYTNQPLPYAGGPYDLLAVFWDDLDFTTGGGAYYFTDGRRFVVEYKEVSHFGVVGTYTFQVILYPDGRIKYQYLTMDDPKDKATVGIQNSDGTDGLEVVFNAPYLKDSLAVMISASVPWMSVTPDVGTVEPAESLNIGIKFQAPSIAGEYQTNLMVSSNDCEQILDSIPVNLNVAPCSIFYGDVNADCITDVLDVINLINYLFNEGIPPNPEETGDVNCDSEITICDAVYLINYIFRSGPPPIDCSSDSVPITLFRNISTESGRLFLTGLKIETQDTIELGINVELEVPISAAQITIKYNPRSLELVNVKQSFRTLNLSLFYNERDGQINLGLVDVYGKNIIPAGEDAICILQFKNRVKDQNLEDVKIKKAILADLEARAILVKIEDGIRILNLPQKFTLFQNYPNPFNPTCVISYVLPVDSRVTLSIFNILGQRVRILVDEYQYAGYRTVKWDGKDEEGDQVASGIYFYKIFARDFVQTKKMLLLK